MPRLAIALVTYERTHEAIQTIRSTHKNLGYPKPLRTWFVSDDGSNGHHAETVRQELEALGEQIGWFQSLRMRKEGQEGTYYAGPGWNKALGLAHQHSDFVLWLEDDWVLDEELDLVKYVKLLQSREDVGIVSFRILSIENEVKIKGYEGELYYEYLRSSQYAYSGNPLLRHARFTKHYGWFDEERDPGNIELAMDDKYRLDELDGPRIWRPMDINMYGAWKHVGQEKTWK